MKYTSKHLVSALVAFLLVGCNSSGPTKIVEKSSQISGIAVDDLILHGIAKAYPASNSSNILDESRTNNSGAYLLDVSYNGVVLVEVTCDENSRMLNPKTNERIACAENLELHSAAAVTPTSGLLRYMFLH